MRIAVVASGSRGDVQPLVVLADELARRGHDIALGVPPNLLRFAGRTGLSSTAVGPDTQQFMDAPEGREWLAAGNAKALTRSVGQFVHDNAALLDADTRRICDGADLIVAGSLTEHRAACVAEAAGIPLVCLHYAPMRPNRAYPHLLVTTRSLPGPVNAVTHAVFQRAYWRSMAEDINHFRADLELAPATSPTATRLAAAGTLELQAYHRALVPELDDYPANRPIVGFMTPDRDLAQRLGEADLDPEIENWLADGDPPAYVGFGSLPVLDPQAALEMVVRAADRIGIRVLIGAGWSHFDETAGSGSGIKIVAGTLDYTRLLPRCRLAVHHGGSGTVAASVAAGIPTVVCSVAGDNSFWGTRVQRLGIGTHERFAGLTTDKLAAGMRRALRESVIARSRDMGAVLRADTGAVRRAADLVDGRFAEQRG